MSDAGSKKDGRERRQHARVGVSVRASLEVPPRAPLVCEIYNMSVGGALMNCAQSVRLHQPVVLHVDDFGPISGHVARVSSTVIAISFDDCDESALADFLIRHQTGLRAADLATSAG